MPDPNILSILSGLARGAAGHRESQLAEELRREEEEERFQKQLDLQRFIAGLREQAEERLFAAE